MNQQRAVPACAAVGFLLLAAACAPPESVSQGTNMPVESPSPALGGSALAAPDQRDGEVLQALLLHLLADPAFDMGEVPEGGDRIVLHDRTPLAWGSLTSGQMRADVGDRALPADAENDLRRRNTPRDAVPGAHDAVGASFTGLWFGDSIVVADLDSVWARPRTFGHFAKEFPQARGWVMAYLPGYSADGACAIVRASVGPSDHGATVTAILVRAGDRWQVDWFDIAWYV